MISGQSRDEMPKSKAWWRERGGEGGGDKKSSVWRRKISSAQANTQRHKAALIASA